MSYRDIDLNLTQEQSFLRDTIREFGKEVIRPAGLKLDKMANPADAIAKDSVFWDVSRQFRELGLHKTELPESVGGNLEDMDAMSQIILLEEMGYADPGIAVSMAVSSLPFSMAAMFPNPKLQEIARAFSEDTKGELMGCWAISEPAHGSDYMFDTEEPAMGPSVRGIQKGNEYIINGQKAAWVSNGTIATHAVVHVGLDPSKGMRGQGLAIIPLDLPGISRGQPLDKLGQRSLNQGEIFFEDARIPEEYMVITPDMGIIEMGRETRIAQVNGGMALMFAGMAKAAYDEAFNYAAERIQGGVPINEHQNIKLKLFRMFNQVEAARAAARRMTLFNYDNPTPSGAHAVACKCLSTETAFQVASEAIQIFGGNGLTKEYPIEKMFRDARASMIEDGVNETLMLGAFDYLKSSY
jgi:alkylation response protein AidB-like acyl-CoA dehydrogenase